MLSLQNFQKIDDTPPVAQPYFIPKASKRQNEQSFIQEKAFADRFNMIERQKSDMTQATKIFIKPHKGQLFTLEVDLSNPIADVKTKIQRLQGIRRSEQKLFFTDQYLEDSQTLAESRIRQDATLSLMVRSRGGPFIDWIRSKIVASEMHHITLNVLCSEEMKRISCLIMVTVDDLKKILSSVFSITVEIDLLFKGQILTKGDKKLSEYCIGDNSTIYIVPTSWGSCIKLLQSIPAAEATNLLKLKESLAFLGSPRDLKHTFLCLEGPYQTIKDNIQTEDFKEEKLYALILWTSNLLHKQINQVLGEDGDLSNWIVYLKCFLQGLDHLPYHRGKVYRGIRNQRDLETYKIGEQISWKAISGLSRDRHIAEKFCDSTGTIFEVDVVSSKDISKVSLFPEEEEVILPPHSCFEVINVIDDPTQPLLVQMREIPVPRGVRVLLWVDDNPEDNYKYALQLGKKNISCVFCTSTTDALDFLEKFRWILNFGQESLRIVTDMSRYEGEGVKRICNYEAGIELVSKLVSDYNYNEKIMVFCMDTDKAQEKCKIKKLEDNCLITRHEDDLSKFINFS